MNLVLKKEVQFYPAESGLFHVYDPGTMRHFKIGEREVGWLRMLTGRNSRDDLAKVIPEEFVDKFIEQVQRMQLVESAQVRRRWNPFKLKLRLFNPDRMLDAVPRFNRTYRTLLNATFLISLILNIVWMVREWPKLAAAALTLDLNVNLVVFYIAAVLGIGLIHEMSHAIVAKSYDIHVPAIGLMLFYLHPAFFADISGLNLLKSKRQRINILMAGLMANSLLISLSIPLWYGLSGLPSLRYVTYFILLNLAILLVNLVPFVEYDGYYLFLNLVNDPAFKMKARQSLMRPFQAKPEYVIYGMLSNLFVAALLCSAILVLRNYVATLVHSMIVDYASIALLPLAYFTFILMQNRRPA